MSMFQGKLVLDFGDSDVTGPIAYPVNPIRWICDVAGYEMDVIIEAGWPTDGTTLPGFLWWFMPQWGDKSTFAAIGHDFLLWYLTKGTPIKGAETREKCDQQYYQMLKCLGVAEWKARLAWSGVRAYSITYGLTGWPKPFKELEPSNGK